jgi:hypothetical protein
VGWEVCVDYGLLVKCQCCVTDDGRKCKLQWCHRLSTAGNTGGDADRNHRWGSVPEVDAGQRTSLQGPRGHGAVGVSVRTGRCR